MKYRIALTCTLVTSAFATLTIADPPQPTRRFTPGTLGMTVPLITSHKELDAHLGQLVAVRGPNVRTKASSILEVDVRNPKDLAVDDAYAVGILARHDTTDEDIAEANRRSGPIATRGPGITYTLYFDLAGKLADARAWPSTD